MDQESLLQGLLHTKTSHNPFSDNHSKSENVLDSKYLETGDPKYLETGDFKFESLDDRDLFGKDLGEEPGNPNDHRESVTYLEYSSQHQMNDYVNKQPQTCSINGVSDSQSCYTPDPSVIASTNLNLSRLSSPLNSTTTLPLSRPRTNTLLHRSSYIGMHSSQTLSTLPFNSSTTSIRRASTTKLHHQPSKLDLIDDTTLTSLPLPPPPKSKSKSRPSGENSSLYSIEDINISYTPTQHDDSDNDDDTQDPIVLIEDYMTPLKNDLDQTNLHKTSSEMLIDGPVPTSNDNDDQLKHLIQRKRSLATFKQRIFKQSLQEVDAVSISDASITSTLNYDSINNSHVTRNTQSIASFPTHKPNNKRSISHDIVSRSDMNRFNSDVRLSDSSQPLTDKSLNFRPENLEEIFGKIPGTDLLKYCDLCEKPLYEISSILNNNKKFKTCTGATTTATTIGQVYSEFICWECIETYEEFFNELSTTELDEEAEVIPEGLVSSGLISSSGSITAPDAKSKLLKIFQSVHDKYTQQGSKASKSNEIMSASSDKWTTSLNTTPPNTSKTWTSHLTSKRSFFYKQPTYKQLKNKTSFSETLMQRLNYLNNVPEGYSYNSNSLTETKSSFLGFVSETKEQKNNPAPKRDLEWIKNLQAKLRWSWGSSAKPLGSDVL